MRRLALVAAALFLVNLPVVSQHLAERKLAREGEDVVATVLDARRSGGHDYVDYRLPAGVDARRTRFSAAVDTATFEAARATHQLPVRVVPGDPSSNVPAGVAQSQVFLVVAILGDTLLLLVGVLWWRRHRRWHRFTVLGVEPGEVTLGGTVGTLVAAAPEAWTARIAPGGHVSGGLHLVAEQDLDPGSSEPPGLERISGARYLVRGRVLDTKAGWAQLELDDGFRLRVETGPHRIRADIREPTLISGMLCFTPR